MLRRQPRLPALTFLAAFLAAGPASADPQLNTSLTLGGGFVSIGDRTAATFHLGGRGDLLFLRQRESDMAVGPFVSIESEAFRTMAFAGGVEWLLPAWGDMPFLFAAGAYERNDSVHGYEPGAMGSVTWGLRGYNFHGIYAMGAGLFVEGRHSLGDVHDDGLLVGVAVDLTIFAYPFLLAYGALTH